MLEIIPQSIWKVWARFRDAASATKNSPTIPMRMPNRALRPLSRIPAARFNSRRFQSGQDILLDDQGETRLRCLSPFGLIDGWQRHDNLSISIVCHSIHLTSTQFLSFLLSSMYLLKALIISSSRTRCTRRSSSCCFFLFARLWNINRASIAEMYAASQGD